MVSYQVFTEIAFSVAGEKGAEFSGIQEGGQFISEVANLWQENKQSYKQMTRQQVRSELEEVIEA